MSRRRKPDYDRDRRRELEGFVEKSSALAKELREAGLREDLVPPLEEAERVLESRRRKHGD